TIKKETLIILDAGDRPGQIAMFSPNQSESAWPYRASGIYKLEGDRLTIAWRRGTLRPPSKPRSEPAATAESKPSPWPPADSLKFPPPDNGPPPRQIRVGSRLGRYLACSAEARGG